MIHCPLSTASGILDAVCNILASSLGIEPPPCVPGRFDRFKVYVSGREESLARTFQRLDLDHDGHLTAAEVEAGLQAFAFTCPFSRCVYRTKEQARTRRMLEPVLSCSAPGYLHLHQLQPLGGVSSLIDAAHLMEGVAVNWARTLPPS